MWLLKNVSKNPHQISLNYETTPWIFREIRVEAGTPTLKSAFIPPPQSQKAGPSSDIDCCVSGPRPAQSATEYSRMLLNVSEHHSEAILTP